MSNTDTELTRTLAAFLNCSESEQWDQAEYHLATLHNRFLSNN